jgi:hypothetical protein
MKYAVNMGLGALIYVPSFITFGGDVQNVIWGDKQTHNQEEDHTSILYEIRLKVS